MTKATWGAGRRLVAERFAALLSSRTPFLTVFACLLLLNWGVAVWIIHYTYQQREVSALQLVNDETRNAEQRISALFSDADRKLRDLRTRYPDNEELRRQFDRWIEPRPAGGIAMISPGGEVLALTPEANTAGWPRLLARLADSDDVLAIGEPILSKSGHFSFVPAARRILAADGGFGGILMLSLPAEAFPQLSPAIVALDGCASLVSDDGIILARVPDMRGTVGIRMTPMAERPAGAGMGRKASPFDGVDRIFSYRHLGAFPATVAVGISYDVAFADWEAIRLGVVVTRLAATGLILLTGYLWYTRQRRARISGDALTAILTSIDRGIRVENAAGTVIAANAAGAGLRIPNAAQSEIETSLPDGSFLRVTRHAVTDGGSVLIGTDVTARQAAEARIDFLTNHDPLTGLPNRWRATTRIQDRLAGKTGADRLAALVLLDLDGFQDINDTLGHEGGDQVLTEVASRLRDLVGEHDVVARLGGDEFLLFLVDPENEAAILCLARQVPRALARPIALPGQTVRLGASIGIAVYPRDGADPTTLFRHADLALSQAKLAGRGTARSFAPEMMASFEEHRMMESDLRRALDSDELELCMQPQFSCDGLDITGFEALARWRHPTRGDLAPSMFIPIAERSGLINPLGLWAIEQACRAAAGWRARHRVAVNLSPLQLRRESIQEDIRMILRRTQFPAHLLELEVTESVLLEKDRRALETLHKLRAMDIRITLDDFGTGYSSLSYLRRFPFDKIKIDKSFIQGQGTDRATKVILETMIRMCTDLGLDVVAEGVETEQQLSELRRLGCREVQGFLLGAPLRADTVDDFLIRHERRRAPEPTSTAAPASS